MFSRIIGFVLTRFTNGLTFLQQRCFLFFLVVIVANEGKGHQKRKILLGQVAYLHCIREAPFVGEEHLHVGGFIQFLGEGVEEAV